MPYGTAAGWCILKPKDQLFVFIFTLYTLTRQWRDSPSWPTSFRDVFGHPHDPPKIPGMPQESSSIPRHTGSLTSQAGLRCKLLLRCRFTKVAHHLFGSALSPDVDDPSHDRPFTCSRRFVISRWTGRSPADGLPTGPAFGVWGSPLVDWELLW